MFSVEAVTALTYLKNKKNMWDFNNVTWIVLIHTFSSNDGKYRICFHSPCALVPLTNLRNSVLVLTKNTAKLANRTFCISSFECFTLQLLKELEIATTILLIICTN